MDKFFIQNAFKTLDEIEAEMKTNKKTLKEAIDIIEFVSCWIFVYNNMTRICIELTVIITLRRIAIIIKEFINHTT